MSGKRTKALRKECARLLGRSPRKRRQWKGGTMFGDEFRHFKRHRQISFGRVVSR